MNIKVLGPGCKNCHTMKNNVQMVAQKTGWQADIEEITDPAEIVSYGVMRTPGLIIDGELVSMGKVLAPSQIEELWAARR